MDHIGARNFPDQARQVGKLGHDRPQVFDLCGKPEEARRRRIHWDEPRMHVRIVVPRAKKPIGLNGLTTENAQRRGDDGYLNLGH